MTGLLKDLMNDRADHVAGPHVDIEAIVADGDKRVRRRRIATGTGIAAAVAAVALAVVTVPDMVDRGAEPVQPAPTIQTPAFTEARPTYAGDSTIHYGDQQVSTAPYEVVAFVQTDAGFVFSTPDYEVYLADGDGTERIGTTDRADEQILTADGPYAAWIDWSGDAPALVVYDTVNGDEVLRTTDGTEDTRDWMRQPAVEVIDGGKVYWHNADGVVVSEVTADGPPINVLAGASSEWLNDAVDGVLSYDTFDGLATIVSREVDDEQDFVPGVKGRLSADASYVATDVTDHVTVYDAVTRKDVTLDPGGYVGTTFSTWLDDDRYNVWGGFSGVPDIDLLTCSVARGTCVVAEEDVTALGPDGYEYQGR